MATFKRGILISLVVLVTFQAPGYAASWYTKEAEGWLWYKYSPKKIAPKVKQEKTDNNQKKKKLSYREQAKQQREQFEEVQSKAVLVPTLENVLAFQRAQNTVLDKADIFQKMLMLASMIEAQNNSSVIMASPASREIHYQEEDKKLEQEIKKLAKSYGIFFLFKNDCPYCHQFAPVVKEFLKIYPFEVKAISKDGLAPGGLTLKEFPDAVLDNGTIDQLNPEGIYPCLLLVNPQTRDVIPLAKGLINIPQLKENLKVIIRFLNSQGQRS